MPKPTEIDHVGEVLRVGVRNNATNTPSPEVFKLMRRSEGAYMEERWEISYLLYVLYKRGEWAKGLNRPARNLDYVRYIEEHFPHRYTESHIMMGVDCYHTYSELGDEIVAKVKEFAGLTKPHTAIPHVQHYAHDLGAVHEILALCQRTSSVDLRAALREHFPIRARAIAVRAPKDPEPGASPAAVVRYLATRESIAVIAEQIFVPRHEATLMETEYAYYALAQSYLVEINHKVGVDDLFDQMFRAWLGSLEPRVRTKLLRAAHHRWLLNCVEPKGGKRSKWPFGNPDEQLEAAE